MAEIKELVQKSIEENKILVRKPEHLKATVNRDVVKLLFIEVFRQVDKTMKKVEWLPEYDEVIDWSMDNQRKGLVMIGNVGRGKSIILNGVLPVMMDILYRHKKLTPFPSRQIPDFTQKGFIGVDDFGIEEPSVSFGNRNDYFVEIVEHCEDHAKLLFGTSNLSIDEIKKRYDDRIWDRIQRLSKVVLFTGKSLRK